MKNNQPKEKTKVAVKKAFKNNVLTVKFKISGIQAKAGKSPDFDKPKVVSRGQKSKADDLVFIKIAMSNHPPPTPTPPG